MGATGPADQRTRPTRAGFSEVCSAMLRVGATLDDLDAVLQETVDSARTLTDARFGIVATVDEAGASVDYVTSGFSAEEKRRFDEWQDASRLLAHLHAQADPSRLSGLRQHIPSLGFSADCLPSETLLAIPMRHQGRMVGSVFLAEKMHAAELTAGDEELLAPFAAHAAAAVVHARALRDERRVRADLEALMETSPAGLAVLDARTGRASLNGVARRIGERLLEPGLDPQEAFGTLTCRFADGSEVALEDIPTANAGALRDEEVELAAPDGGRVRMLLSVAPMSPPGGDVASVAVALLDLAQFEQAERQRAAFIGMVSHELRAPLMAIKGSAATALGAVPAPPHAELMQYFRIVEDHADRMRGLVSDLLDMGRIEAGALSVVPRPTTVPALVDAARATFTSGGARHAVRVDVAHDLPPVLADGARIAQVIANLLSNAARRSPESSPILVEAEHQGVYVAVSVSDRGRAVPPEMLGRLFSKHVAFADADARSGPGGGGLGLAICKGVVEAHGGRIRAESDRSRPGTRLTFTLPTAEEAPRPPRPPERWRPPGTPAPVLVVDDDPQTLRFVRRALRPAGYRVVETGEPENVAPLMRAERPRLVLLDLMLPGTDGIELMEGTPELANVPVIFISGYDREETIARALDQGAADYIVKPFSATELAARVGAAQRGRSPAEPFVLAGLAIDYERRRVTVNDRELTLTATEYEVLRILSSEAPRVVTNATLLQQVWGSHLDPEERGDTQRVRNFVRKLRDKLGESTALPQWIINERGVGYRMPAAETD